MDNDVDQALVERFRSGDREAFTALMVRYQRPIYNAAFWIVRSADDARDIAQSVFLKVAEHLDEYDPHHRFFSWIYRIAVNLCKNRTKYLRVRHAGEQDELEAVAERVPLGEARRANVAQIERPDEAMASKQVERIVQEAIQKIDPTFRECLILRDVEELSYEEIEQITGLAAGTVKSRIFRARAQLKEIVERELGEKIG